MRQGPSSRRQRSRNAGRRNPSQQRNQVYDSNGPDVRIRGTAHQVAEKYLALAKDASSAGDIIVAENYYQHAEHYIRIIGDQNGNFDANKILGHTDSVFAHDPDQQDDERSSNDDPKKSYCVDEKQDQDLSVEEMVD